MNDNDRMEEALRLLRANSMPEGPDLSARIMATLRMEEDVSPLPSNLFWAVVGVIILAALTLIPFGNDFSWLLRFFDSWLIIPVSITLGCVLTIYASMYIGSHLDELSKRFKLNQR